MSHIFNIITILVGLVLSPFQQLPAIAGIAAIALLTAVFALLIYKKFSNQEGITRAKKRIFGYFFGIYLFRDDLGGILRQFGRVLGGVLRYMTYALPPLLLVLVPMALLAVQMQLYYGYRNPAPGEVVNSSVVFDPAVDLNSARPELSAPAGVKVETPPVRIPFLHEAAWRLRVNDPGNYALKFRVGDERFDFLLRADTVLDRIYPLAGRPSFLHRLLYPGGPLIPPSGPFLSVRLDYPAREIPFLWFKTHWSIVYLVFALVFGLLLKKPLRVDF